MDGFKILAIRPLTGTSQENRKNLKIGVIYKFYNDYSYFIKEKDGKKGSRIDVENSQNLSYKGEIIIEGSDRDLLDRLYSDGNNNSRINVSAIIGKNGSGKSTLIELLLRAVNNIIFKTKKSYPATISLIKGIDIDLFYEINGQACQINVKDAEIKNYSSDKGLEHFDLTTDFFFTHLINYSLYSFINNDDFKSYFHRNDSYWDPIFISPKRENNMIDIRHEIDQSENNLLFHLSHSDFQNINKIAFSVKKIELCNYEVYDKGSNGIHYTMSGVSMRVLKTNSNFATSNVSMFQAIYKSNFTRDFSESTLNLVRYVEEYKKYIIDDKPTLTKEIIKGYLIVYTNLKVNKIVNKKSHGTHDELPILFTPSLNDPSHESFKFYQSIFLLNKIDEVDFHFEDNKFYLSLESYRNYFKLEFEEFNLFQKVPLSGFKIHLYENNIDVLKRSSGQLQQINFVSNILTTLINLNSRTFDFFIENNEEMDGIDNYENVCVILDEIELNMHPELQRGLLLLLINSIENLQIKNLSINIVFLTHSPFILSDIPFQNTLRIENGEPVYVEPVNNSFAANIHDLLADDFFMKNGFIGDFAKEKINSLINDPSSYTEEDAIFLINLIGDNFIKGVVLQKYKDFQRKNMSVEDIDSEINKLEELKKNLL
ncbi:MAG TPA: hypothetical protein VL021_08445 [Brumimicrobium sp.]|nr:hypothetical protein [Brumimicrobium sp.]